MAYKLIALDLDDTLLNSQKQVSAANRDAIEYACRQGVHIVLASGRAFGGVKPLAEALKLKDYTIVCGGAQIVDPDEKIIFSEYLSPIATKQVMRWAALRGIHFQVYTDEGFFYLKKNKYSDYYEKLGGYIGNADPDLLKRDPILASKILLVSEDENLEGYRKELEPLFPELLIKKSQACYLEILNPEATKGNALEILAKKLDLEQHELMAIGDSEIDESMLQYAGLGIAMENAASSCKKCADDITSSCEDDGVARSIIKYIPEVSSS